jgi:hypothetical protein
MTGNGATSPLPCLSAKVPSPPDLQTFATRHYLVPFDNCAHAQSGTAAQQRASQGTKCSMENSQRFRRSSTLLPHAGVGAAPTGLTGIGRHAILACTDVAKHCDHCICI